MYRYPLFLALAAFPVLGCGRPPVPSGPFPMQDGVREFRMSRTLEDPRRTRLCFTLLDGTSGCATYGNGAYDWPELTEPVPLDSLEAGPVSHLALDEIGYCFVNAGSGITCEEGRPLDDPAVWQALRGVVGLEAARSRICAWTVDHEVRCSTGSPPDTAGKALIRLRGEAFNDNICAVTLGGEVFCDESVHWTLDWLAMLEGVAVQDVGPSQCGLLVDGTAVCWERLAIEGRYDTLWPTRDGRMYFTNPKQAVYVDLLPDEPEYDLGNWERVGLGMINNTQGTPTYIDHDGLLCALVEDTVYCI